MVETRRFNGTLFKRIVSGEDDEDGNPGWSCTECVWRTNESAVDNVDRAAEKHAAKKHELTPLEKDHPKNHRDNA